jgi:hypothetical protein
VGLDPAGGQQPRDAVREHPGLARAGAGEDQQRPAGMLHGVALGLVHPGEKVCAVDQRTGAGCAPRRAAWRSGMGGGEVVDGGLTARADGGGDFELELLDGQRWAQLVKRRRLGRRRAKRLLLGAENLGDEALTTGRHRYLLAVRG